MASFDMNNMKPIVYRLLYQQWVSVYPHSHLWYRMP